MLVTSNSVPVFAYANPKEQFLLNGGMFVPTRTKKNGENYGRVQFNDLVCMAVAFLNFRQLLYFCVQLMV
jgi:hypothetical protein